MSTETTTAIERTTAAGTDALAPAGVNWGDALAFEHIQRVAKCLASSELVPTAFRNNIPNTVISLEMAQRIGASPLAVMQSLYIVHGRPSWSAQFIIAALNASRRYSPLRFRMTGTGDNRECVAHATERETGEPLEGPPASIAMAKAEGWYNRQGSKWQTMPELMLRYRAATFFGRLYAPEILMGMRTDDEVMDIVQTERNITSDVTAEAPPAAADFLRDLAAVKQGPTPTAPTATPAAATQPPKATAEPQQDTDVIETTPRISVSAIRHALRTAQIPEAQARRSLVARGALPDVRADWNDADQSAMADLVADPAAFAQSLLDAAADDVR